MSGQSFVVPPRSWAQIEKITLDWRSALGVSDHAHLPIVDIVERVLDQMLGKFRLVIEDATVMGGAEGYTDPQGEFIVLREDVYEGACRGRTRDRFTLAHELGSGPVKLLAAATIG